MVFAAVALCLGISWGLPSRQRVSLLVEGTDPDSLSRQIDQSSADYFAAREAIESDAASRLSSPGPASFYDAPPLPKRFSHNDKLAITRRYLVGSASADERQAFVVLARMEPRRGDLNPRGSPYGGAFIYPLGAFLLALRVCGIVQPTPQVSQYIGDPSEIRKLYVAGRLLAVLPFLGILVLFARIGASMGRPRVGTFAMLTWALSSMPQNQSLVTKPHVWASFWVVLAVHLLIRCRSLANPRRDLLLGGLCIGLAAGSSLPSLVMLPLVPLLFWRERPAPARTVTLAVLLALLTLLATNIYMVIAPSRYLVTLLHYASQSGYGYSDPRLGKLLDALRDMFIRGYAIPLGIIGGLALLGIIPARDRPWRRLAVVWIVGFLLLAGLTGEIRYGLFLGALLCLYAGLGLDWLLDRPVLGRRALRYALLTCCFVPAAVLSTLSLWSVTFSEGWVESTRAWVASVRPATVRSIALLDHPEPQTLPALPFLACNLVDLEQVGPAEPLPELVLVGSSSQQRKRWENNALRSSYVLSSEFGLGPMTDWLMALRIRGESRTKASVYSLKHR